MDRTAKARTYVLAFLRKHATSALERNHVGCLPITFGAQTGNKVEYRPLALPQGPGRVVLGGQASAFVTIWQKLLSSYSRAANDALPTQTSGGQRLDQQSQSCSVTPNVKVLSTEATYADIDTSTRTGSSAYVNAQQRGSWYLKAVAKGTILDADSQRCRAELQNVLSGVQKSLVTDSRSLSWTAWSVAKLRWQGLLLESEAMQALCSIESVAGRQLLLSSEASNSWDSFGICRLVQAYAELGIPCSNNMQRVMLEWTLEHAEMFTGRNLCNFLFSISRLGFNVLQQQLDVYSAHARNKLLTLREQELCMLMFSFASLSYRPQTDFIKDWIAAVQPSLDSMARKGLALILSAAAKLPNVLPQEFIDDVLAATSTKFPEGEPPWFCDILWAVSRRKFAVPDGFAFALLTAAAPKFDHFNPTLLTLFLRSASELPGEVPEHVLQQFLAVAQPKLQRFNPERLAKLAQALTKLKAPLPEHFAHQLLRESLQVLQFSSPGQLVDLLGCLVWSNSTPPLVMIAVLRAAEPKLYNFSPSELSKLMRLCAKVRWVCRPAFLVQVESVALRKLHRFAPRDIAYMLEAMTVVSKEPRAGFMHKLLEEAEKKVADFGESEVHMLRFAAEQMRLDVPDALRGSLVLRPCALSTLGATPTDELAA